MQAVPDSHAVQLTKQNLERLTPQREPEDEKQSDVVVKRC
jgi:hypothetical protein